MPCYSVLLIQKNRKRGEFLAFIYCSKMQKCLSFRGLRLDRLSSTSPKILAFISQCSGNFRLILNCSIPKFKLKHEDSENIIADRVTIVVFNLHQIKHRAFFLGHSVENIKNVVYTQLQGVINFSIAVCPTVYIYLMYGLLLQICQIRIHDMTFFSFNLQYFHR